MNDPNHPRDPLNAKNLVWHFGFTLLHLPSHTVVQANTKADCVRKMKDKLDPERAIKRKKKAKALKAAK